ncbi:hypothetical protein ACLB1Q_13000 [Escherichia coli]
MLGNSSTASHNVQVNTALPGITINPVATDDVSTLQRQAARKLSAAR